MNEYGALVKEWLGRIDALRGNPVQYNLLQYRSHMDWPRIEPGPLWWEGGTEGCCEWQKGKKSACVCWTSESISPEILYKCYISAEYLTGHDLYAVIYP